MDSERIEGLLEKYWRGETSLEEEAQLHQYFRQTPAPDALKEAAMLFRYFGNEKNKRLTDASFDASVIKKVRYPSKGRIATLVFNTMRIAAGIIVLVLAVWLVRMELRKSVPDEMADTYDDPKMAFEETKKALMMISRSFSTAEEQAKKINLFNEAQQDLKKEETASEL